jgi:CRISPR/Cas system-associated protein Csx1
MVEYEHYLNGTDKEQWKKSEKILSTTEPITSPRTTCLEKNTGHHDNSQMNNRLKLKKAKVYNLEPMGRLCLEKINSKTNFLLSLR